MTKLHELVAVEADLKSQAVRVLTDVGSLFTNGQVRLASQTRQYTPVDEDGETFPQEHSELATTVGKELDQAWAAFSRWVDVAVQKEQTNGQSKADVVIDGKVILTGLSAPALLNLEAKLTMIRAVYVAIPTNDPSEKWEYDLQAGHYISDAKTTYRTKKVPRALVGAPATEHQPANVQYYTEDIREGSWNTVKRSGMLSPTEKNELLERLDALSRAVKTARQRANEAEVTNTKVASVLRDYINGK